MPLRILNAFGKVVAIALWATILAVVGGVTLSMLVAILSNIFLGSHYHDFSDIEGKWWVNTTAATIWSVASLFGAWSLFSEPE